MYDNKLSEVAAVIVVFAGGVVVVLLGLAWPRMQLYHSVGTVPGTQ